MRAIVIREEKGDLRSAMADYDESLRLEPTHYAYGNRALLWKRKKDYDRAIANSRRKPSVSIQANPTHGSRAGVGLS